MENGVVGEETSTELWQEKPCLYNVNSQSYSNNHEKRRQWKASHNRGFWHYLWYVHCEYELETVAEFSAVVDTVMCSWTCEIYQIC